LWKYDGGAGPSTTADAVAIGLPNSVQRVTTGGGGGGGGCWLYPWKVDVDVDVDVAAATAAAAAATVGGKRLIWLAANSV